MVDFRYHLISLIAVFLALGLGILMGTVVLNDQLVDGLERDIKDVRKHNQNLEDEIDRQDRQLDAANVFANEAARWLLADALRGRTIVVVQLEGSDGDMVGVVRDSIESAGGEIVTTVVLTDRFALEEQVERDRLALAIESSSGDAVDLRVDAGAMIGARLAAAAAEAPTTQRPQDVAQERLRDILRGLESIEFVSVDPPEEGALVPANSMFLVLGGAPSGPAFDADGLMVSLVAGLSSRGAPTLVGEHAESTWGLVVAVREDPEAGARVATVDQANTTEGGVAVVLGLDRAFHGVTDHYGVGPGATQVIPDPAPEP